jgi:TetR/AcrR family transcriptional regulator, ethionamide resistance regulator
VTVERAVLKSSRRRGTTKGDLKEEAILETCERLLAKKELNEIGVDELAAGAGISRPTFYFYFESKDAVLRALVARIAEEMFARAETWLDRTDEPPEVSTMRTIEATAEVWQAHGPVLRAAVQNWGTVPEMRAFGEGLVRRFVGRSAQSIRDARKAGDAPPGPDPQALATALIWMNERCFYTSSLSANPALSREQLVPTLTTIWLRAIYSDVMPPAAE